MAQLNEKEMQLAALISEGCTSPAELTAKLKNLFSGALEKMLESEMDEHLGYEKNSRSIVDGYFCFYKISMDMWELTDHDNGWIPDGKTLATIILNRYR
ncbi:hypothetical protein LJD61_20150 [Lutispora thermophila]|uniref:Uncharacterized protein n=1 Tax=Lutispora saccharofermentans TaxID=3024236 RepID=A0ABT1NKW8_9FIRM|nr:hypothetical protein [Lutispora saccharofermentans]MCQ1531832.1 hypothetical protein [Lutispora saccharofermentans]